MGRYMKLAALGVVFCLIGAVGGCSKKGDNWLVGKWVYDAAATKANLPADNKAKGVPDAMAGTMGKQLTEQLMSQMDNAVLDIGEKTMTAKMGNGAVETGKYTITERPDANTIVMKADNGETSTFIRIGKYICVPTTGGVEFNMYFKPAN